MDPAAPRPRCFVYIDGFNFYYGCVQTRPEYKWLNFRRLCELLRPNEAVERIYYFTALVKESAAQSPKRDRQKRFWAALRTVPGLEIVLGRLIERERECKVPGCSFRTKVYLDQQEKLTDVNIAIRMVSDAILEKPDLMVLISGDTDLIPPVEMIQKRCPSIKLAIYVPSVEEQLSHRRLDHYRGLGIPVKPIPEKFLRMSQFNNRVVLATGKSVQRPPEWA